MNRQPPKHSEKRELELKDDELQRKKQPDGQDRESDQEEKKDYEIPDSHKNGSIEEGKNPDIEHQKRV